MKQQDTKGKKTAIIGTSFSPSSRGNRRKKSPLKTTMPETKIEELKKKFVDLNPSGSVIKLLDKKLKSTNDEDKMRFMYFMGDIIFEGKHEFGLKYYATYNELKKAIIPKKINNEETKLVKDWVTTLLNWLEEDWLQNILMNFFRCYSDLLDSPEMIVEAVLKEYPGLLFQDAQQLIIEELADPNMTRKKSIKTLYNYIYTVLSYIHYHDAFNPPLNIVGESLNIPENFNSDGIIDNTVTAIVSRLKKYLYEIGLKEIELILRKLPFKIFISNGEFYGRLSKEKIKKHRLFAKSKFENLEDDITHLLSEVNIKKKQKLNDIITKEIHNKIIEIKANDLRNGLITIFKDVIDNTIDISEEKLESMVLGEDNQSRIWQEIDIEPNVIFSIVKHHILCAIKDVKFENGFMLRIGLNDIDNNIRKLNDKLIERLFSKREQTMPYVIIPQKFEPKPIFYRCILPLNHCFTDINSLKDLISSLRIAERSVSRIYKHLLSQYYLFPSYSKKAIKSLEKRNQIIESPEHSTYGHKFCATFASQGGQFSPFTITYKLSIKGNITREYNLLSSYENIFYRLHDTKLYNYVGDMATFDQFYLAQIYHFLHFRENNIEQFFKPSSQLFIKNLTTILTFCLFLTEGFRNPASFVTHALRFMSLITEKLTMYEAIMKKEVVFPMVPPSSTTASRFFNNKYSAKIRSLGDKKAGKREKNDLKKRLLKTLEPYKEDTYAEILEKVNVFWKGAYKIPEEGNIGENKEKVAVGNDPQPS